MSAQIIPGPERADRPYEALFINHRNMEPEVPRGSIAFIEPPGFSGDGIYSIPFADGKHYGDIRRIFFRGDGYGMKMDNWPDHGLDVLSKSDLERVAPRRVAGIARPFTNDFAEFLRQFKN